MRSILQFHANLERMYVNAPHSLTEQEVLDESEKAERK